MNNHDNLGSASRRHSATGRPAPFTDLQVVALARDLPTPEGIVAKGTVGTILQVFDSGRAYQVEFEGQHETPETVPLELLTAPSRPPLPATAEQHRRTLVVGPGILLRATVNNVERLIVEGTIEASAIRAVELLVAEGGLIEGSVEARSAEIAGTIDGILTARGDLFVRSTGQIYGKTNCRRLRVEDGARLNGELKMMTDNLPVDEPA